MAEKTTLSAIKADVGSIAGHQVVHPDVIEAARASLKEAVSLGVIEDFYVATAGDDETPTGPKIGEKEGPTKEGQEMALSPEQAGWLLQAFKLDSERRLPMGQGDTGKPRDRERPTW